VPRVSVHSYRGDRHVILEGRAVCALYNVSGIWFEHGVQVSAVFCQETVDFLCEGEGHEV